MSQPYQFHEIARLPRPGDNAAIATRRLARGTSIQNGADTFVLDHDVLEGHRFAVRPIAEGEDLLSWGLRFGIATRVIAPGNYVVNSSVLTSLRERNITINLPDAPNFRNQIDPYKFDETGFIPGEQVEQYAEPRTFLGYRRSAARGVGTRNIIVVLGLSSRAASYARALAIRMQGAYKNFPNMDGIAAVAHTEGSGGDPLNNFEILLRTLAGMMVHPNVGAVLAVSHPDDAVREQEMRAYLAEHNYPVTDVPHAWLTLSGDLSSDLVRGTETITGWLETVNRTPRNPQSLAHLKVALQCGGSDAFSGISGNPLEGAVAREILRYGGTANLGETDELIGAEEYVLKNVRDAQTARDFLTAIKVFQARLSWHGVSAEGNPSGGNQFRGLYNISLKSLGAAMKKDPTVRLDRVISYSERMTDAGFYFMDSPGNDLEGIAGQVAAGCNLIFFTTGNGSITNFPFVPTIKIVTTTGRYNLLSNEMDVNAGAYLDGMPLDELTAQTLDLTVRIISGEQSKGERAAHSQVSIWRNWRQTDARGINVVLEMPTPNGEPIPLCSSDAPIRPLTFPTQSAGERSAHEFVGLVLPTSLCAAQVARLAAEELNQAHPKGMGQLSRFVTLTHTEGCGSGGDSYMALYKRTMLNYMLHPMVRAGVFVEHGCEITHNDAMRHRLQEMGGNPADFGWVSIQLDGGIENALHKTGDWFTARNRAAEPTTRAMVGMDKARIGLMVSSLPPPQIVSALASVVRNIVAQGGTLVMPSTSPLLQSDVFVRDLLGERVPNASLAYGQFAAVRGLHIMDAPSRHWVETLSGLGATGVELVLAYVDTLAEQGHPFIPMLEFTNDAGTSSPYVDVSLHGSAGECAVQIEASMCQMLAGEISPRAASQDNRDFQITRAQLGVTV